MLPHCHVHRCREALLVTTRCRFTKIAGLEPLRKLRVLNMAHNSVSSFESIRPLSLNTALSHIVMTGNPIAARRLFRATINNLVRIVARARVCACPRVSHGVAAAKSSSASQHRACATAMRARP